MLDARPVVSVVGYKEMGKSDPSVGVIPALDKGSPVLPIT